MTTPSKETYARNITAATDWTAVEAAPLVRTVVIEPGAGNAAAIQWRDSRRVEHVMTLQPYQYDTLTDVDLSKIEVKHAAGDSIRIVGGQ